MTADTDRGVPPSVLEDGWKWKYHHGRGWCEVEKKTDLEIEYAFAVVLDDGTIHAHGMIPISVMFALLAQRAPGLLTQHALRHDDAALKAALADIASAIYDEQINPTDVVYGPGGSLDVGGRDVRSIAEDARRPVDGLLELDATQPPPGYTFYRFIDDYGRECESANVRQSDFMSVFTLDEAHARYATLSRPAVVALGIKVLAHIVKHAEGYVDHTFDDPWCHGKWEAYQQCHSMVASWFRIPSERRPDFPMSGVRGRTPNPAVVAFAEKWSAYTKLHSHVPGTMIDAESAASFEHRTTARHLEYKQWLDDQFMRAARRERDLP